jgi:hypothetical protein
LRTTKERNIKIAYEINEQRLKRLDKILKEIHPNIEYEIECSDDSRIRFTDLRELFEYANPSNRKIVGISLSTDWESKIKVQINYTMLEYSPIRYQISGEDKDVIYYSNRIEDELYTSKVWYGKIRYFDFSKAFFLLIIFSFIVLTGLALYLFRTNLSQEVADTVKTYKDLLYQLTFQISPLLLLGLGFFLDKIKTILFPIGVFALGEGIARNKKLIFIRNLIFTGVLLPIIIGVIVNMIL